MQISGAVLSRSDEAAARYMRCLIPLTTSPATRKWVSSKSMVSVLGGVVHSLWAGDSYGTCDMTRTSELLQALIETLVQPQDILLQFGRTVVAVLLPELCTVRCLLNCTRFM